MLIREARFQLPLPVAIQRSLYRLMNTSAIVFKFLRRFSLLTPAYETACLFAQVKRQSH